MDQHSRSDSPRGPLIDLIYLVYFPGLNKAFKKLFKHTPMQVCFKGQNTIKLIKLVLKTSSHVWISMNRSLTPIVAADYWSEQLLWEWKLSFIVCLLIIVQHVTPFAYVINSLWANSSSLVMKVSCCKLKLVEIDCCCSFKST